MMRVPKPKHQSQRKDAVRNYTTQHVPGAHLNFSQRQTLASDWNAIVNAGCRITLRQFAAKHGLRHETWRREHLRGATGAAVPDPKDRRRRKYAEYDPFKAQDEVNENNANKGPADCSSSSTARAGATSSRSWSTSRRTTSSRRSGEWSPARHSAKCAP